MVGVKNAAIVVGFFGREIGGENAIGAGLRCGSGKFFEAHLEDGIVVAEKNEWNLAGLANAADEIEDTGKSGTSLESALGGALNRGAIGEGIAEGHTEFDDVSASIG